MLLENKWVGIFCTTYSLFWLFFVIGKNICWTVQWKWRNIKWVTFEIVLILREYLIFCYFQCIIILFAPNFVMIPPTTLLVKGFIALRLFSLSKFDLKIFWLYLFQPKARENLSGVLLTFTCIWGFSSTTVLWLISQKHCKSIKLKQ